MEHQQLEDLYNKLVTFANASDEAGAQKLLKKHFEELPEDLQADILTRMYFSSVERAVDDTETLARVQERGLSTLDALEALKKKLESEGA